MHQFATLVGAIGQFEIEIEQLRKDICACSLFEPFTAFKRIDQQGNGFIDIHQLSELMQDNNVLCNQEELNALLTYMDHDADGVINYQEYLTDKIYSFLSTFLPKENIDIKTRLMLRSKYRVLKNILLPQEVEAYLSEFCLCIVTWNTIINKARQECFQRNYFDLLNSLFGKHRTICVRRFYLFFNSIEPLSKETIISVFKLIDKEKKQKLTKFQIYSILFQIQNTSIMTDRCQSQSFISTTNSQGTVNERVKFKNIININQLLKPSNLKSKSTLSLL